jgi:hypothetical protein
MPRGKPACGRPESVYVVHLNDQTRELTNPGSRINLTAEWLVQNATVGGEGTVDHLIVSPAVTAYFDVDGAHKATLSCLLFPDQGILFPSHGRTMALAGPVVFVCWNAKSSTEATIITAQHMSVVTDPPYAHPLWPTVQ